VKEFSNDFFPVPDVKGIKSGDRITVTNERGSANLVVREVRMGLVYIKDVKLSDTNLKSVKADDDVCGGGYEVSLDKVNSNGFGFSEFSRDYFGVPDVTGIQSGDNITVKNARGSANFEVRRTNSRLGLVYIKDRVKLSDTNLKSVKAGDEVCM
jgi:anaerobic selenocysteine-containing dehydrogenase